MAGRFPRLGKYLNLAGISLLVGVGTKFGGEVPARWPRSMTSARLSSSTPTTSSSSIHRRADSE